MWVVQMVVEGFGGPGGAGLRKPSEWLTQVGAAGGGRLLRAAMVLDLNGHFAVASPIADWDGRPAMAMFNTTAASYLGGGGGLITAAAFDLAFSPAPPPPGQLPPPPVPGLAQAGDGGGAGAVVIAVDEAAVQQLLDLGVCPLGAEQARATLQAASGDVNAAVQLMFGA